MHCSTWSRCAARWPSSSTVCSQQRRARGSTASAARHAALELDRGIDLLALGSGARGRTDRLARDRLLGRRAGHLQRVDGLYLSQAPANNADDLGGPPSTQVPASLGPSKTYVNNPHLHRAATDVAAINTDFTNATSLVSRVRSGLPGRYQQIPFTNVPNPPQPLPAGEMRKSVVEELQVQMTLEDRSEKLGAHNRDRGWRSVHDIRAAEESDRASGIQCPPHERVADALRAAAAAAIRADPTKHRRAGSNHERGYLMKNVTDKNPNVGKAAWISGRKGPLSPS